MGENTALSCGSVKLLVENLGIVVEIPLYDWGSPKILSEAFTSPIVDLLPTQTSKLLKFKLKKLYSLHYTVESLNKARYQQMSVWKTYLGDFGYIPSLKTNIEP